MVESDVLAPLSARQRATLATLLEALIADLDETDVGVRARTSAREMRRGAPGILGLGCPVPARAACPVPARAGLPRTHPGRQPGIPGLGLSGPRRARSGRGRC